MSRDSHDGIENTISWTKDDDDTTNSNYWVGKPPDFLFIQKEDRDCKNERTMIQSWLDSLSLKVDGETLIHSSKPSPIPLYKRRHEDVVKEKDLLYKTLFDSLVTRNPDLSSRITSHKIDSVPITIFWPNSSSSSLLLFERACVHCHGGGWLFGDSKHQAAERLLEMSKKINAPVISVEYRMGPNHPYPDAVDDVESILNWLLSNEQKCRLVLSGESAGAQLILLAALRMIRSSKNNNNYSGCIAALNLVYGVYDLAGTYLLQIDGDKSAPLSGKELQWMMELHIPSFLKENRTSPELSPFYADDDFNNGLLPPALFTVGTADPLLDDTILMASKYAQSRSNQTKLAICTGGQHGIGHFGMQENITLGQKARRYTEDFLVLHLNNDKSQDSLST